MRHIERSRKYIYSPVIGALPLSLRPEMKGAIYQGIYQAVAHTEEKYSALQLLAELKGSSFVSIRLLRRNLIPPPLLAWKS